MSKLSLHFKKPGIVFCAVALALLLIFLSFFNFQAQVDSYIVEDMRLQVEEIQKNSVSLIRNEMDYLKRLTASAAQMLSHMALKTDEDILQALQDYANTASVVRTLFVTLDGQVYTNYAGYLGQSGTCTSIDGIPLSEITKPIFSQPYYAEELNEVVFGVIAPTSMANKKGVLISSYNIEAFSKLMENKSLDTAPEIGIINSKGEVVSGKSTDEFNLNIFEPLSKTDFENSSAAVMKADFENGKSGFSIYRVGGVARYCSYAPIGLNQWYVVVMVKENVLRSKLVNFEQYGLQLTIELVLVMLSLLIVIMTIRLREQKKIRMILERAAMLDGLTGIYNRKAVEEAIDFILHTAGEAPSGAMLVIDVDNFKQINDQKGHLFGDTVLKECANRLNRMFEEDGIVGRIGGDEFVAFLRDCRDMGRIEKNINDFICNFYVLTDAGEKQKISVSVGIAHVEPKANTFLTLYQLADDALYRAKQTGKEKLSR